jgi:hypothetical protein
MRSGFVIGRKTRKVLTVVYLNRAETPIEGPFTLTALVSK